VAAGLEALDAALDDATRRGVDRACRAALRTCVGGLAEGLGRALAAGPRPLSLAAVESAYGPGGWLRGPLDSGRAVVWAIWRAERARLEGLLAAAAAPGAPDPTLPPAPRPDPAGPYNPAVLAAAALDGLAALSPAYRATFERWLGAVAALPTP